MSNPKIIVGSGVLLIYLSKCMDFLKNEAKLVIFDKELHIDGFKGLLVESQGDLNTIISVDALRNLQKFLRSISDQPLTIRFDYYTIYVHSIII